VQRVSRDLATTELELGDAAVGRLSPWDGAALCQLVVIP
jgi:hypothetical protein